MNTDRSTPFGELPAADATHQELRLILGLRVGYVDHDHEALLSDLSALIQRDRARRLLHVDLPPLADVDSEPEPQPGVQVAADDLTSLFVSSAYTALGAYVAQITYNADTISTLTPPQALAYVHALSQLIAHADYLAAVRHQLRRISPHQEDHELILTRVIAALPHVDTRPLRPLLVDPANQRSTGLPMLAIRLHRDAPFATLTLAQARLHIIRVLEAVNIANLDQIYKRVLVSTMTSGLPEKAPADVVATAEKTVTNLAQHRLPEHLHDTTPEPEEHP